MNNFFMWYRKNILKIFGIQLVLNCFFVMTGFINGNFSIFGYIVTIASTIILILWMFKPNIARILHIFVIAGALLYPAYNLSILKEKLNPPDYIDSFYQQDLARSDKPAPIFVIILAILTFLELINVVFVGYEFFDSEKYSQIVSNLLPLYIIGTAIIVYIIYYANNFLSLASYLNY